MLSQLAVFTALLSSSASVGVTATEAEGIFKRLCETNTVQQRHQSVPFQVKATAREEVALWYPDGVTISRGFLQQRSDNETAWALALHIGTRLRPAEDSGCDARTGLRILSQAGYDPFLPAATWHRQIDYLRRVGPDWQLGALALELTYGAATLPAFRDPAYQPAPVTGAVEKVWQYDDPAWTEWFAQETGRSRPSPNNRFAAGQCTALAFALFPEFPFDPRGGGRNDAKNWITLAKAAGWHVATQPTYLSIGVQDGWGSNPAGHVFVCLGQSEDGKIRAIDSNFGKQPDNKVRVRVFDPDKKILGYLTPPAHGQTDVRRLTPSQTTLRPEAPYWHAPIDGRTLDQNRNYALQFRVRTQGTRGCNATVYCVGSTSQTATQTVQLTDAWQTVTVGSFCRSGGGDVIPQQLLRSIATFIRYDDAATLEITDPLLVPCS